MSFGKISIQVPLKKPGGLFLLLNCMSSLYILGISVLSNIWLANIFIHPIGCLFTLQIFFPLLRRKFAVWCSLTCLFLVFFGNTLGVIFVNHCQDQCHETFSFCFPLECLGYQSYASVVSAFWVDFYVLCKIRVQWHSFVCDYPVFLVPLIGDTISHHYVFL
jgi:hypothetical protein